MGIVVDISQWNEDVNFDALVENDVTGVIIKAGSGNSKVDPKMELYAAECIKRGIDIGFYWFVYLHNGQSITENAMQFVKVIQPYKDYIKLKVWCDYEYDTDDKLLKYDDVALSKDYRTGLILDFCNILRFYGYNCGIYANKDYLNNKLSKNKIKNIPLWYARYTDKADDIAKKSFLWQCSSKFNINGKLFDKNILMNYNKTFRRITVNEAFKACGIPHSYEERKIIAIYNGISNYSGTVEQNAELVKLLADEKLRNPF